MQKLYEITGEYLRALNEYQCQLAESEEAFEAGEIDGEELDARYAAAADLYGEYMGAIEGDFATKAERVAMVIRNLEQEASVNAAKAVPFMDEAERYIKRRRTAERQGASLKAYLLSQLQQLDLKSVEGDELKVRRQNNGRPAVNLVCLDEVPEDYRIVQPDKVDTGKVVTHWRTAGKVEDLVPGLAIKLGQHVRIS